MVLASSRDASRDRPMGEFDSFLLDSFSSSFHGLKEGWKRGEFGFDLAPKICRSRSVPKKGPELSSCISVCVLVCVYLSQTLHHALYFILSAFNGFVYV